MTPKEKAVELYNSFDAIIEDNISATDGGGWDNCSIQGIDFTATKSALITVDEILKAFDGFMDARKNFRHELELDAERYWLAVKVEIGKM